MDSWVRHIVDALPTVDKSSLVHLIVRWGFSSAAAAYLIWNLVETQRTSAEQLKDLNGQLIHISNAVGMQRDETNSTRKILMQICVNGAETVADRRACLP